MASSFSRLLPLSPSLPSSLSLLPPRSLTCPLETSASICAMSLSASPTCMLSLSQGTPNITWVGGARGGEERVFGGGKMRKAGSVDTTVLALPYGRIVAGGSIRRCRLSMSTRRGRQSGATSCQGSRAPLGRYCSCSTSTASVVTGQCRRRIGTVQCDIAPAPACQRRRGGWEGGGGGKKLECGGPPLPAGAPAC